MNGRGRILVAAVVAAAAIAAACAGETFSGGEGAVPDAGGDASAGGDGAPGDAEADGGKDDAAGIGDAASPSACAAYDATFCDDFERTGPPSQGWLATLQSDAGSVLLAIDDTGAYSPTRELTAGLTPSGGEQYVELSTSFATVGHDGVHVEVSLRPTSSGDAGAFAVAFVRFVTSGPVPYGIDVGLGPEGPTLLQRGTSDAGSRQVAVPMPAKAPAGTWTRLALDVPFGPGQTFTVWIDGVKTTAGTTLSEDPSSPTSVALQVGAYDNGPRAVDKVVHVDDVVLDLR